FNGAQQIQMIQQLQRVQGNGEVARALGTDGRRGAPRLDSSALRLHGPVPPLLQRQPGDGGSGAGSGESGTTLGADAMYLDKFEGLKQEVSGKWPFISQQQ